MIWKTEVPIGSQWQSPDMGSPIIGMKCTLVFFSTHYNNVLNKSINISDSYCKNLSPFACQITEANCSMYGCSAYPTNLLDSPVVYNPKVLGAWMVQEHSLQLKKAILQPYVCYGSIFLFIVHHFYSNVTDKSKLR